MSTIWITAYALTKGIVAVEESTRGYKAGPRSVVVAWSGGMNDEAMFHGDDWHRSEHAAQQRVIDMVAAKRTSMQKTLLKLAKIESKASERLLNIERGE